MRRLSGRIAHDINNYLYVVHATTEALSRLPGLDARCGALIESLRRNTAETGELMEALLAFSGARELHAARLDIAALGASIAAPLREALGAGIALELEFAADCWPVYADREALAAALLELAANARDAMPQGGRFALRALNAGDEVRIVASDDGEGMTPQTAARAFEPFCSTRCSRPGLGLSRIYGFVHQSGGRVELESEPGRGTRVTLSLPRMQRRPAAAGPASRLQELQVLVVEDESLIRMLAEDLLGQLGCRVVGSASSVEQALALARAADIDFAVVDVNLRGEPAYPVADALQARGVPFVFVSAYGELERAWRERPIVHKPIELDRLKHAIERALGPAAS